MGQPKESEHRTRVLSMPEWEGLGKLVAHLAYHCTYVQVGHDGEYMKFKITKLNRSNRYDHIFEVNVSELSELNDVRVIGDIAIGRLRDRFNEPIR